MNTGFQVTDDYDPQREFIEILRADDETPVAADAEEYLKAVCHDRRASKVQALAADVVRDSRQGHLGNE